MNDRQRRWTRYLLGIWLALLVFSTIADIVTEPSLWNWTKLAVLAIAAPWLWHRHGRAWLKPDRIEPEAVPAEDVEAVVAESGRTVYAIKSLREKHPGLGLRDAKNLVQPDH